MAVDTDKLMDFIHRFAGDLGATAAAGNVVVGHRLGLYRSLAEGPATPDESRRAVRLPSALPRGVAGRSGRGRLRHLRRGQRHVLALRGAGLRPHRPRWPGLPARRVRPRARGAAGRAAHHRRVPHRGRPGLARAGRRRVRRVRAVLPSRVRGEPRDQLDPGPRRRRGHAASRRHRRRRRLRVRRLHGAARSGVPGDAGRGLRLPRGRRSTRPASAPPTPASRAGPASRSSRHRPSPGPATTWSPRSTACTTWATRSAPPATSASPSPTTAPG